VAADGMVVIVGGTSGLGRRLAETFAACGDEVLITGRDSSRAQSVAAEIGDRVRGCGFDLAEPHAIAGSLDGTHNVKHLVLAAIERDSNSVRDFDLDGAVRLATLKLVGYTEVLHCLHSQMDESSSVLLFGGLAKDRPYPGSTTVTSVNGAVSTMVRTFATELAPVRVNAIHPGIVGDSPAWEGNAAMLEQVKARTPTGRLVAMDDVVGACLFLLQNPSVNGVNLPLDGGWVML
jgi:NAD(P)-dependent dehydrogenase (short-subunit alcohol dehydrogenase family)